MNKELLYAKFSQALKNPAAQYFLKYEQAQLNLLLPQIHGYYGVQLGIFDDYDIKSASTIMHQIYVGQAINELANTQQHVIQSGFKELPFQYESIDLFFLPHALEYVSAPSKLLNEIYNSLIPGGKVIIFGFNPLSLLGLTRWIKSSQDRAWNGNLTSLGHVKFWLRASGFTIEYQKLLCYRPPLNHEQALERWQFLEALGETCFPFAGSVYALVGQKKKLNLVAPVKKVYKEKKIRVPNSFPEPSTLEKIRTVKTFIK